MRLPVLSVVLLCAGTSLSGQATLADAAKQAVSAWIAHDPERLVGGPSRVALEIPGANPSVPVAPAQAAELLRRYLRPARERSVAIRQLREETPDNGFVVLERVYTLAGTSDERRETVYLRFHRTGTTWQLTELRAAP